MNFYLNTKIEPSDKLRERYSENILSFHFTLQYDHLIEKIVFFRSV